MLHIFKPSDFSAIPTALIQLKPLHKPANIKYLLRQTFASKDLYIKKTGNTPRKGGVRMQPEKKVDLVSSIKERILSGTGIKDEEHAEEIARRWVGG